MTGLTRTDLENWGISVTANDDGTYVIYRTGRKYGRSKEIVTRPIKQIAITKTHKYGKTKTYMGVEFSLNNKAKTIVLSRLVYAYFIGDIPANMDVDHIDNDSLNNKLSNLRLLTRKQNLAKRFMDNPTNGCNQWSYINK